MILDHITAADRGDLMAIAAATGLFAPSDAEQLLGGVCDQLFARALPDGHMAWCCRPRAGESPIGWSYFAPDQYADGVWNLWWLGVRPEFHGSGAGRQLLRAAESEAAARKARVIVVETSALEPLARARRFYAREGYAECGRVPDFYGEGDAKVIFARRPRESTSV